MFKDMFKIMMWHIWEVTYLRGNVTIVCGASYHLLGFWISQDSKIRFWLQVESYISNWQFSESQHSARYVSRHNAMAYDKAIKGHQNCQRMISNRVSPSLQRAFSNKIMPNHKQVFSYTWSPNRHRLFSNKRVANFHRLFSNKIAPICQQLFSNKRMPNG